MKKEIHPENYRLVAFKDMSNNDVFLTKSTADTKDTLEVEGVEYPLVKLEISRTSHPFYTGKAKFLDTAGRIDKFKSKYGKFKKAAPAETVAEPEALKVEEKASSEEE
ncbi:LSU ribosomal protein L31p @ LSU ribosomal protein L31p, zinc-independent [hydrothermal vent metagenome]|uniref:LSU ribosomal protein L31p @ LSU ribosomal protein L31p, zinc-independent n=1 Tax=hydrothermal vent metagenome TaxID=652676 RepID=A0A3B0TIU2_9ZZZZ